MTLRMTGEGAPLYKWPKKPELRLKMKLLSPRRCMERSDEVSSEAVTLLSRAAVLMAKLQGREGGGATME